MSDADIEQTRRDLIDLERESSRQQAGAKEIQKRAAARLKEVESRLAEIHGMTEPDEYQSLLKERGALQQILES